jgi:hypothetical protein
MYDAKEWQRLKKEINRIITAKLGWKPPIQATDKKGIRENIEGLFDHLENRRPEKWKTELGLPPEVIELWEKRKKCDKSIHFFQCNERTVEELVKLSGNAIKVLAVFAISANNGKKVNGAGMQPGETFVGNETVARRSGVGLGHLHEYIKEVMETGFLVNVRKHPKTGTWIRRVTMNPDEWPSRQTDEPVVEPESESDVFRQIILEHNPLENQDETYEGKEWENYTSSPGQTQAESTEDDFVDDFVTGPQNPQNGGFGGPFCHGVKTPETGVLPSPGNRGFDPPPETGVVNRVSI